MTEVLVVIIATLIFAHIGGIATRAIYIMKAQRPTNGLNYGTIAGLAGTALLALLRLTGTLSIDDVIVASIALPLFILIPFLGAVFVFLPQKNREEQDTIIPFYYDIDVLKVYIQVWFGVLFVGSIALLWVSLTTNLAESEVALDFNVYERRFGAAISEGIAFNEEWGWVGDLDLTENLPALAVWSVLWLGAAYLVFNNLKEQNRNYALGAVGVMVISLPLHPTILNEIDAALVPYLSPSTMTRALITGFSNTLRVSIAGVIASTILGILLGIGMLSNNYLVRSVSNVYTEIFRNTPLLVQLIFIYQAFLIILPDESFGGESTAWTSPDSVGPFNLFEKLWVFSAKGARFVNPVPTDTFIYLAVAFVLGLVAAFFVRRWRLHLQDTTGTPAKTWFYAIPTLLGFTAVGWWLAGGFPIGQGPFTVDYPEFVQIGVRRQYENGFQISLPFMALFLALTLYTAAFIGDIVRAGIQSVSKGQLEAARSLGLNGSQVLGMVIMPQALRLIIPPLGNQYVNLGKNSSLGFAVGFGDVFTAVQLANNESGQSVPFFVGMMIIYLSLSLFFSAITNLVNSTTQLRTR